MLAIDSVFSDVHQFLLCVVCHCTGSYTNKCMLDLSAAVCETIQNICSVNAQCSVSDLGAVQCACNNNYQGNGVTCTRMFLFCCCCLLHVFCLCN